MGSPTLLVPMQVNAMVVNKNSSTNNVFRRWEHSYDMLNNFSSSEPDFCDITVSKNLKEGIYIHWILPDALKRGAQNPVTGNIEFPLVPNRWVVLRFSGPLTKRVAKAFIIESDAPGYQAGEVDTDETLKKNPSSYIFDSAVIDEWKNSKDTVRREAGNGLGVTTGELINGLLGRVYEFGNWSEKGIEKLFVTAVASGNHIFSAYQSHCRSVFSLEDDLEDVESPCSISYMVAGWYSNEAEDPIKKCNLYAKANDTPEHEYEKFMEDSGWQTSVNEENQVPLSSIYHGMVFGVDWDEAKIYPSVKERYENHVGKKIRVAIGNTSVDCFKALIQQQLLERAENNDGDAIKMLKEYPNIASLLEAFQYDMLDIIDSQNGQQLLDYRIRQEWFSSKPGGYRWVIADDGKPRDEKTVEQLKAQQQQESWISQLNSDQEASDMKFNELYSYQWKLYAAWWKKEKYNQYDPCELPEYLNIDQFNNDISSITQKICEIMNEIEQLKSKIPYQPIYNGDNNTQEKALEEAIVNFQNLYRDLGKLSEGRILKAIAAPRYWKIANPVVMVSGGGNTAKIPKRDDKLLCRLSTDIISGIKVDDGKQSVDVSSMTDIIPAIGIVTSKALQGDYISADTALQLANTLQALIGEFYILDPNNSAAIVEKNPLVTPEVLKKLSSQNFNGVLPSIIPGEWEQPWNPIFMKWVGDWYPIEYKDQQGNRNWTFHGTEYKYNGNYPSPEVQSVGGEILLTPQTGYIFKERLEKLIIANQDTHAPLLDELDKFVESIDNWDFISQSLDGFNEQITIRDNRTQITPFGNSSEDTSQTLQQLMGNQCYNVPYIKGSGEPAKFHGVRQGQLLIRYMTIYDTFGQVLELVGDQDSGVDNADSFPLIISEGFIPDKPIIPESEKPFIQLPPAVMQHGRLDFRLIDSDNEKYVDIAADANPIAGWLLPNHLDASLSLYNPQGINLGSICTLENDNGTKYVSWKQAPDSEFNDIEAVRKEAPWIAALVENIETKGVQALNDFLQIIDTALWNIDPVGERDDGNISVLIGKPLALVRAKLKFQLEGLPINEFGWKATFDQKAPDFVSYNFEIRLGDKEIKKDGLIGYYLNQKYDTFNSVYDIEASSLEDGYIKLIEQGNYISLSFDGQSEADVMMLVDPCSCVHALTGILPVQTLQLPAKFIEQVVNKLEVNFQTGPVLTKVGTELDKTSLSSIKIPIPTEKNGMWSWWEKEYQKEKESWKQYGITAVEQKAVFSDRASSLREGWLKFVTNGEKK